MEARKAKLLQRIESDREVILPGFHPPPEPEPDRRHAVRPVIFVSCRRGTPSIILGSAF